MEINLIHQLRSIFRPAAAGVALVAGSTLATAQDLREDIGASECISLAAELGVLSVQMTTAACNMEAGIAEHAAADVIETGAARFAVLENALLFGDTSLGVIGPETRQQNLVAMADIREKWDQFKDDLEQLTVAANDLDFVNELLKWDGQIRQDAVTLLSEFTASYADSILLLQTDTIRLQFVANERLHAARISRNFCALNSGFTKRRVNDELQERFEQFDAGLSVLANGMEALGIAPPPTAEIKQKLSEIGANWAPHRENIERFLTGETADVATREELFIAMNSIGDDLRELTNLYVASSKLTN